MTATRIQREYLDSRIPRFLVSVVRSFLHRNKRILPEFFWEDDSLVENTSQWKKGLVYIDNIGAIDLGDDQWWTHAPFTSSNIPSNAHAVTDEPMDGVEPTAIPPTAPVKLEDNTVISHSMDTTGDDREMRPTSAPRFSDSRLPSENTEDRKRPRSVSSERSSKRVRTEEQGSGDEDMVEEDGGEQDAGGEEEVEEDGGEEAVQNVPGAEIVSMPLAISVFPNAPVDLNRTDDLTPTELVACGGLKFVAAYPCVNCEGDPPACKWDLTVRGTCAGCAKRKLKCSMAAKTYVTNAKVQKNAMVVRYQLAYHADLADRVRRGEPVNNKEGPRIPEMTTKELQKLSKPPPKARTTKAKPPKNVVTPPTKTRRSGKRKNISPAVVRSDSDDDAAEVPSAAPKTRQQTPWPNKGKGRATTADFADSEPAEVHNEGVPSIEATTQRDRSGTIQAGGSKTTDREQGSPYDPDSGATVRPPMTRIVANTGLRMKDAKPVILLPGGVQMPPSMDTEGFYSAMPSISTLLPGRGRGASEPRASISAADGGGGTDHTADTRGQRRTVPPQFSPSSDAPDTTDTHPLSAIQIPLTSFGTTEVPSSHKSNVPSDVARHDHPSGPQTVPSTSAPAPQHNVSASQSMADAHSPLPEDTEHFAADSSSESSEESLFRDTAVTIAAIHSQIRRLRSKGVPSENHGGSHMDRSSSTSHLGSQEQVPVAVTMEDGTITTGGGIADGLLEQIRKFVQTNTRLEEAVHEQKSVLLGLVRSLQQPKLGSADMEARIERLEAAVAALQLAQKETTTEGSGAMVPTTVTSLTAVFAPSAGGSGGLLNDMNRVADLSAMDTQ
ncbi:hypothetical protein EUX98_g8464 [Antrodiella citrinella]|uniref:Zn(2)-C6 fungal-type domain-containing protein n=1 Tax=Antrodiella citrinella TaxID=2447956 RepID=A0A4S4M8Y3_9APHY|nr:hypothetical protein EUX98_g8464 [Antrodiella citrinella]